MFKLENLPQLQNKEFILIIDDSGSIMNDYEKIKQTIIDMFSDNIKCKVIETSYNNVYEWNFNSIEDLTKLKLKGLSGCYLEETLLSISDEEKQNTPVVIVTDGYISKLNLESFSNATILSTDQVPHYNGYVNLVFI